MLKSVVDRFEDLSEDVARTVDQICCLFEAQCRSCGSPNIDKYLSQIPTQAVGVARQELLAIQSIFHPDQSRNLVSSQLQLDRLTEYQILAEIGRGGMGIVLSAIDPELDRQVALKFLTPEAVGSPQRMARFKREARVISSLNHPNICTIYAIKKWQESPYLVLEWIEGQSLRDFFKAKSNSSHVPAIFVQVARGLACAHQRLIVHRDIKPENIIVRTDGLVKLLDFGLARLLGDSHISQYSFGSSAGHIMGTIPYMSPEQIAGNSVSSQSDIFSLGVMLYESLSGVHPFLEVSQMETIEAIERCNLPPPSHFCAEIDGRFDELTMQMLQKDPLARPTASAISKCLSRLTG